MTRLPSGSARRHYHIWKLSWLYMPLVSSFVRCSLHFSIREEPFHACLLFHAFRPSSCCHLSVALRITVSTVWWRGNGWTDLHGNGYGDHDIRAEPAIVLFNFIQVVIPTRRTLEVVRWDDEHPIIHYISDYQYLLDKLARQVEVVFCVFVGLSTFVYHLLGYVTVTAVALSWMLTFFNPLRPSGNYMSHLLWQSVMLHFVFIGFVWF
jgi:hypothetical protein